MLSYYMPAVPPMSPLNASDAQANGISCVEQGLSPPALQQNPPVIIDLSFQPPGEAWPHATRPRLDKLLGQVCPGTRIDAVVGKPHQPPRGILER